MLDLRDVRSARRVLAAATVSVAVVAVTAAPAVATTTRPSIRSVFPRAAKVGQKVTIWGAHLRRTRSVSFGGGRTRRFRVISSHKVVARVPATAVRGRIRLRVRTTTVTSPRAETIVASYALSPASGPPTTVVTLSGAGYGANEAVDLRWDGWSQQAVSTSATGNFGPVKLTVPQTAAPGIHQITATGEHTGFSQTRPFTVMTSWPLVGFGPSQRRFNPYENQLASWTVDQLYIDHQDYADGYSNRTPHVVSGGRLYVGTALGNIYAYDAAGTLLWKASTAKDVQSFDPVIAGNLVIFAATDGSLFAYSTTCHSDGSTCTPTWTRAEGASASLNVARGVLYVPDADGSVHRLNPATGASVGSPLNPFGYTTPVTTPYVVGADGTQVWANGTTMTWMNPTGVVTAGRTWGGSMSTPAVDSNTAFFTTTDGQLHAYGFVSWDATLSASTGCNPAPAVAYGTVFAGGCDVLGAFNEDTGALKWSVPVGSVSGLSVANRVLYACITRPGTFGRVLVAYDANYGSKLWSGGGCNDTPEIVDGRVYAGLGAVFVYSTAPSPRRPAP